MAAKIKAKRTSTISKAGRDPGQKPGQQKQKPGPGGQTPDKKVESPA